MSDDILLSADAAARVAERLLAAARASEIPRWLRYGADPALIDAELARTAPSPPAAPPRPALAPRPACSRKPRVADSPRPAGKAREPG
jgi:hypothetical protein